MRRRTLILLQVVTLLTIFALHLWQNSSKFLNFSFDLDEIFAIQYAKNINGLKLWEYINADLGNPPLFFFLLKPWLSIAQAEVWLRLLPLLFYCASLVVLHKVLQSLRLSRMSSFILFIILLGVGAYAYLSLYLRGYSFLLFMALLSIYLTLKVIEQAKWRNLLGLTLVTTIGLHAHYLYWIFAVFWFAACLMVLLGKKQHSLSGKYILYSTLCSAALSLPLIWNMIKRELLAVGEQYYWWQLQKEPLTANELWEMIFKVNLGQLFGQVPWLSYVLWLLLCLLILFAIKKVSAVQQKIMLLFTILFWPTYLLTPLGHYLDTQKYIALFIFLFLIALFIAVSSLINALGLTKFLQRPVPLLSITTLAIIWSFLPLPAKHQVEGGDDWKTVVPLVENHYRQYGLVTDCLLTAGFDFYGKETIKLFGSLSLMSANDCNLPLISENSEQFDRILLINSEETEIELGIESSYQLVSSSAEYAPIFLTFYEKK